MNTYDVASQWCFQMVPRCLKCAQGFPGGVPKWIQTVPRLPLMSKGNSKGDQVVPRVPKASQLGSPMGFKRFQGVPRGSTGVQGFPRLPNSVSKECQWVPTLPKGGSRVSFCSCNENHVFQRKLVMWLSKGVSKWFQTV